MINPPKVLIVDDQSMMRDIEVSIFSQSGYQTISAAGGEEGFGLALSEHPDLIFTDLNMPGMNGLEMLLKIKEQMPLPKAMMYSLHSKDSEIAKNAIKQIPGLEYVEKGSASEYIIDIANKLTGYSFEEWLEQHG